MAQADHWRSRIRALIPDASAEASTNLAHLTRQILRLGPIASASDCCRAAERKSKAGVA